MWAVRQSPYHAPDGLSEVIWQFWESCQSESISNIKDFPCIWADRTNLESILENHLFSIPQVLLWNERKNGNNSSFGFVSRYDKPTPDDDFIDLYALRMNIVKSCMDEALNPDNFSLSSIPNKDQHHDPTKPETSPQTADAIPSLQGQDDPSRLPLRNSDQPSQAASQLPTKSPAALPVSSNLSQNSRYDVVPQATS